VRSIRVFAKKTVTCYEPTIVVHDIIGMHALSIATC